MQAATAYRLLADLRDLRADYEGACDAHLRAISFCRQKGTVSEEHMCLGCLGYALFRTGQWKQEARTPYGTSHRQNAAGVPQCVRKPLFGMKE